jgi:hypothetical protein
MLELPVIKPPGDVVLLMNAWPELYYSEGNVDAMPPNDVASLLKCGFQHVYNSSLRVRAGHQSMIDNVTPSAGRQEDVIKKAGKNRRA